MSDSKIKFGKIQKEELRKFLVEEKGFNPDIFESRIQHFQKAKKAKPQSTLEAFFGKPTVKKNPKNLKKRAKGKGKRGTGKKKVKVA